jgi:hypothetical protein
MPIRTEAQRNALAAAYGTAAPNGALFTADPGATGAATNELAASGSPAYARKPWGWSAPAASAITGTATFDVYAGVTTAFVGITVSATRATADVRDTFDAVDQAFASQGTYAVTATYTQS